MLNLAVEASCFSLREESWAGLVFTVGGKDAARRWHRLRCTRVTAALSVKSSPAMMRLERTVFYALSLKQSNQFLSACRAMEKISQRVFSAPADYPPEITNELLQMTYPVNGRRYFAWLCKFLSTVRSFTAASKEQAVQRWALVAVHCWSPEKLTWEILQQINWANSRDVTRALTDLERMTPSEIARYAKRFPYIQTLGWHSTAPVVRWKRIPKSWLRSKKPIYETVRTRETIAPTVQRRIDRMVSCYIGIDEWRSSSQLSLVTAWLDWLERWPRLKLTPIESEAWREILRKLAQLSAIDSTTTNRWCRWLEAIDGQLADDKWTLETVVCEVDKSYVQRLCLYRRILRSTKVFPKRLGRLLTYRETCEGERRHLQQREDKSLIGPLQQHRLEYLNNLPEKSSIPLRKIRCELRRTSMGAALEVSHAWIRRQQNKVMSRMGIRWSRSLKTEEKQEMIHYLSELATGTRENLIYGLKACADKPTGYRLFGLVNREWIERAESRGIPMEAWFAPNPQTIPLITKSGSRSVVRVYTLALSNDPIDVLWMGRPFDSCLDLRGGLHSASAAANWMDANKQLLVVKDNAGRLLARKLLALSTDHKLLGYLLYSSIEEASTEDEKNQTAAYSTLESLVTAYCRQLASKMNIDLANEGKPERLHGSLWYDDGTVQWPETVGATESFH